MARGMHGDAATEEIWRFRARPYGVSGYSTVLDAVAQYRLNRDVAERITTPLYITDPDGEQLLPGQSAELGASYHCQPMARELTEQRIFDWLDERLTRRTS